MDPDPIDPAPSEPASPPPAAEERLNDDVDALTQELYRGLAATQELAEILTPSQELLGLLRPATAPNPDLIRGWDVLARAVVSQELARARDQEPAQIFQRAEPPAHQPPPMRVGEAALAEVVGCACGWRGRLDQMPVEVQIESRVFFCPICGQIVLQQSIETAPTIINLPLSLEEANALANLREEHDIANLIRGRGADHGIEAHCGGCGWRGELSQLYIHRDPVGDILSYRCPRCHPAAAPAPDPETVPFERIDVPGDYDMVVTAAAPVTVQGILAWATSRDSRAAQLTADDVSYRLNPQGADPAASSSFSPPLEAATYGLTPRLGDPYAVSRVDSVALLLSRYNAPALVLTPPLLHQAFIRWYDHHVSATGQAPRAVLAGPVLRVVLHRLAWAHPGSAPGLATGLPAEDQWLPLNDLLGTSYSAWREVSLLFQSRQAACQITPFLLAAAAAAAPTDFLPLQRQVGSSPGQQNHVLSAPAPLPPQTDPAAIALTRPRKLRRTQTPGEPT